MDANLKIKVFEYLDLNHKGRRFPIKAGILANHFNTSLREINEVIRLLRKDGRMVGSSKVPPFGYYIPADALEAKEYLNCFRNELMDMLETFRKQRRAQQTAMTSSKQDNLFPIDKVGQMEFITT